MKMHRLCVVFFLLFLFQPLFSLSVNFRAFDHTDFTRIVFEGNITFVYRVESQGQKLVLHFQDKITFNEKDLKTITSSLLERAETTPATGETVCTLVFKKEIVIKNQFTLSSPFRLVLDVIQGSSSAKVATPVQAVPEKVEKKTEPEVKIAAIEEAKPAKLKPIETICIDAGHGGEDFGAVGRKSKLLEKNLTLTISQKLKHSIESRLGLRVIMTRESDNEVTLNRRAAIANNKQAQLFVSIHINSSLRKAARGSETYFVSLNATDREALELANKENTIASQTNGEEQAKDDELKMILWNMAQTEYIRESSRLAEYIQNELNELLDTRNRGVKQAPFRVLMRTAMPAVLIEVAFVSNLNEESKLKEDAFLDKVTAAIYNGIAKFISYYAGISK